MVKFAPFINVTRLSFRAKTASHTIAVMQHSEFPSLKNLFIHVEVLPLAEAEQLLCALSQCKATQTFEQLSISSSGPRLQEPLDNSLTAVPYFLPFRQLRTLYLRLHFCTHLDNDRLLEAISSWPHIRSLQLVDPEMPPAITFRGLFAALRLRPHLHTLSISMDAINIDIDPKAESFQYPALQNLNVTCSEIADAEAVARIIFSAFPRIVRVSNWGVGMRFWKLWDEVNEHLNVLNGRNVTEQVSQWDESEEETDEPEGETDGRL
ncbi:hypothetical protein DEU56DRAFT_819928 [Suillus clintonianus]|uniref:uncharacterized protein n=1 Tax=Suillus clintonianus TaxID=1904413 RepID=UPI001B87CA29|nr:uncharacterized protein DEU56DRAFT_819928 [Suillus clintonianus]KAG2127673.1 hypothetical protein DEU56DRAFT_819928 [Suillus clintonianus]